MNAPSRCLPIALTVYAAAQSLAAQEILVSGLDAVAPEARETSDAKLELVACLGDTRLCHPGGCRFAQYSPDGKWIYSCGEATVARWDAITGALAWSICTGSDDRWVVCDVSSAGDKLLVGSRLGKILVLDAQTGRELRSLTHSPGGKRPVGWVTDVAFSPDGRSAAAVDMKGGFWTWDADSGAALEWPERRELTRIECVTFSHGGELLAVTGFGQQPSLDERLRGGKPAGLVVVLDTATGQVKAEAKLGQGEKVDCATFSPDDKLLALGTWGGATEMRQANDLALRWRKKDTKGWVRGVRFTADGRSLLSHGYENVQRRSVATGEPTLVYRPRCDTIHTIDVSRDETRMLVVFRTDSRIQQWDLRRRRMVFGQIGLASLANALAFSPDGTCLASWNSRGGDCVVWAVAERRPFRRLEVEGEHAGFRDVQFSPDGRHLGVKTDQGKLLTVYTWPDLKPVPGLTAVKATGSFCFSPNGRLMAIGFGKGDIRVQEFPSGKEVARIADTAYNRHELAFTPDGSRLAVSWAAGPHLWDWRNGKMVASLAGSTAGMWMCPSGDLIAGRPPRGDLRLWKLHTLTAIERKHLPKPGQWLLIGGFSRDGQHYATAVNGDALRLRRTSDGRSLAEVTLRDFQVRSIALSPSGKWLAAGSWDTLVKLYRVPKVKAPPAAPPTAGRPSGAPENALTGRLIVAKTKFSIGEEVAIALGITNTSDVPCQVRSRALSLSLSDESGSKRDAHERILICPDRTRLDGPVFGPPPEDGAAIRRSFVKLIPGKETVVATWDLSEMMLPPARRERRDPLIFHRPGRHRVSLGGQAPPRRTARRRTDLSPAETLRLRVLWDQAPRHTALEVQPVAIEIVAGPLNDRTRIKQAKLYAWAFCYAHARRMYRVCPRRPEPTEAIAPGLVLLANDATQRTSAVWNPRAMALRTLRGLGPGLTNRVSENRPLGNTGPHPARREGDRRQDAGQGRPGSRRHHRRPVGRETQLRPPQDTRRSKARQDNPRPVGATAIGHSPGLRTSPQGRASGARTRRARLCAAREPERRELSQSRLGTTPPRPEPTGASHRAAARHPILPLRWQSRWRSDRPPQEP